MAMYTEKYLLCVTETNHNKYYRMIPDTNTGTFTCEYGRVDATPQKATYPLQKWDTKYREKINKGYKDVTDLRILPTTTHSTQTSDGKTYKAIADVDIQTLVNTLMAYADKTVAENYNVSVNNVTEKMINVANTILQNLSVILQQTNDVTWRNDLIRSNQILVSELFVTIPRKMQSVTSYMINASVSNVQEFKVDFRRVLCRETDLLDVLKTKVVQTVQQNALVAKGDIADQTILDAHGIQISQCNAADIERIKKSLGEISGRFHRAWRVTNNETQKRFDDFKTKYRGSYTRFPTKLLWHGSRNQNWWSIINNGLLIRPNGVILTGAMFGNGIYFANKAKKSLGYTSLQGSYWAKGSANRAYMALYDVAYGVPYDVYVHNSKFCSFNWQKLQEAQKGAHCLHAHAGKSLYNDEIIVYKPEQVTIRYLVELR